MKSLAGAIALIAVAAAAMAAAGANPMDGFGALLRGSMGGVPQLAETLVQTSALLFPSLAVALALRAGLFNIGAEGQLVIGGLVAGVVGAQLQAPAIVAVPLLFVLGALGGAVWGGIAGVLRARFGSSEVIATLMLNVLALLLANYLIVGPLRAPDAIGAETATLPQSAWLPTLLPDSRLTIALPLALGIAFALSFALRRTVFGYELRASGDAPRAARRAGIDLGRMVLVAMALSGSIAGLGGATIVMGVLHRFTTGLSPGYGFIAIAVALVGALDPLRICAAAFAFGVLQSGALTMQAAAHVPKDVITLVEGVAIVALAARRFGPSRTAGIEP